MYEILRSKSEIDEILNACMVDKSRFPGMSYEQGIVDFFRWLVGETEEHPYPNE